MPFDHTEQTDGSLRQRYEVREPNDGLLYAVRARIAVASAVAADAVLFNFFPPPGSSKLYYAKCLRGTQHFNGTAAAADLGFYLDRYSLAPGGTNFSGGTDLKAKICRLDSPTTPSEMESLANSVQFKISALTANNAVLDARPFDGRGISGSATGTMEEFYIPFTKGLPIPPDSGLALCVGIVGISGWTLDLTLVWAEVEVSV